MKIPRRAASVPVFLLLLLAGAAADAFPSARSQNEEGNRLYHKKQYKEAQKKYSAAQMEAPNAPQLHYNLGNVLFRQGEIEKAREEYRRALATPDSSLDPMAVYNLGNTFLAQQQYRDAVDAYRRALKLNPSDLDSKRNLELALLRLKQPQPPPQSSSGKDKNDDKQQPPSPSSSPPSGGGEKSPPSPGGNSDPRKGPKQNSPSQKGSLSREEAERILNALQDDEKANLRKRLEAAQEDQQKVDKDW